MTLKPHAHSFKGLVLFRLSSYLVLICCSVSARRAVDLNATVVHGPGNLMNHFFHRESISVHMVYLSVACPIWLMSGCLLLIIQRVGFVV